MNTETAETIALQALAFLVKDEKRLSQMLEASGLTAEDLKKGCQDEAFLGGILDNILKEDNLLLDFCTVASLSPKTLAEAREALPGGAEFFLD